MTLIEDIWSDIEAAYSSSGRYYHTLHHLENMLNQIEFIKTEIVHYDELIFALAYHDIVYKPMSTNNEEKSAEWSGRDLAKIGVAEDKCKRIKRLILATKKHLPSANPDEQIFMDADLSILGSDPSTYADYVLNVRKEYSVVPDLLYKPGRRKILKRFLEQPSIFKTNTFADRFEERARLNIQEEIRSLS